MSVATTASIKRRLAVDRQQLLILLMAAVMAGSFCLLVLWPKHCELQTLGAIVDRERSLVSEKMQTRQDGLYVSARLSALRRIQDQLAARLPNDPQLDEFLMRVADCVAAQPGVTHEIAITDTTLEGRASAIPIRLRLAGPFAGVQQCLAAIEQLDRLSRFRRVHLTRADDSGQVAADAELVIYHLSRGATATPDGAAPKSEEAAG
jgi:Tfp pilus assembly protein PilO